MIMLPGLGSPAAGSLISVVVFKTLMIRVFQITVLSCVALLLTCCSSRQKGEPIWQDVKIGDIAAPGSDRLAGGQLLKTIDFSVCIFEIPAENISALDGVWRTLEASRPLRFDDYDAFGANLFSAGFGRARMWNRIADLLRAAGGKKIETVSLLIPDGQYQSIAIAGLDKEQTIFYASTDGSMAAVSVGPGELTLRIRAEKIPGWRGVCKVSARPVFSPPMRSAIPLLATSQRAGRFVFTCCGFGSRMSPGDFVFLGPREYHRDQMTLAGLFFSRPRRRPVLRTYLIICTGINE